MVVLKREYARLKAENEALRNTALYKRLLEFEQNLAAGRVFTREDLGF
ncbi:hypothetical protein HYY74_02485 [Candidatus Woesearchaeota archaeon]|nr:hypothetical protein [Candidatus Woesearchaeota archaeon]